MKLTPEVRAYLAAIGRKGGKSESHAKKAAVRENGKMGGRPRDKNPSAAALYRREYRKRKTAESAKSR